MGRVKARLNKVLTESVPMNGHGVNGHAPDGEHPPAAIGSAERDRSDGSERAGGSDQHA
jgi:hypothetical protein